MNEWKTELQSFLEMIFSAPYGTKPFWVTVGIALAVLLIFGWLIANFIFAAKRGFILTFIAQALPGAAAIAGWIAVTLYAVPELNAGAIRDFLPLAGAILAAFLTTMIFARILLGISEGKAFFSILLSYAFVAGAIYMGGSLVKTVDSGLDNLEHEKQERESEAESILNY